MKMVSRLILAVTAVGVLTLSAPAQAVMFSVSDIAFTNLIGNTEGLRWTVTPPTTVANFDLNIGDSYTFTFGIFTITHPINSGAGADNDDQFTVGFNVMPPNPAAPASRVGMPDATYTQTSTSTGYVDFNNTELERTFGIGGKYFISFLDTTPALKDVAQNLQATIRLVTDSEPAPVPEPGTLLLLGAGLVGLAFARKNFK